MEDKIAQIILKHYGIVEKESVKEIKQFFKDMIGEDYEFTRPKEDYLPEVYRHLKAKNELRAELRAKLDVVTVEISHGKQEIKVYMICSCGAYPKGSNPKCKSCREWGKQEKKSKGSGFETFKPSESSSMGGSESWEERFDKHFEGYFEEAYEEKPDINLGDELKQFISTEIQKAFNQGLSIGLKAKKKSLALSI